jgi:hypothetical protein
MELGIDLGKLKEKINWKHLGKFFIAFILRRVNIFIFILMFLLTGFFVHLWYFSIYKAEWSEMEKQEYIKNKDKGIVFNKNLFEAMVEETKLRSERFQKTESGLEDIFRLKR